MGKTDLVQYFQMMSAVFGDLDLQIVALHGDQKFCTWEAVFNFTVGAETPGIPFKEGEKAKLFNASTIEWNDDGKIVRQKDYAVWPKTE